MTRRCFVFAGVALVAIAALAPLQADAPKPGPATFRAGAFAQDVTPPAFPVSVNGGMADRKATSAHDPLHARCLVFDDGTTKVALVVVDSCMIPRELIDATKAKAEKKTGIPAANILVSATHTHTAPTLGGVFQSDPNDEYVKFLADKIAEGIEKAHGKLAPAMVGWGAAAERTQVFNRRWRMKPGVENKDPFGTTTDKVRMNPGYQNPGLLEQAGPVDPEVSVLAVRGVDGKPVALFANYSLHYVGDMPALSADYFGLFGDLIGPKLNAGPGFVGILSNGTSGDVNNIDFAGPPPGKRDVGEQSRVVAAAVAGAAKKAADTAYRGDITLAVAEKEIELGVRKPTAEEIRRAEALSEAAKGRELRGVEEVYARETVLLTKYPDTVKLKIQAIRVGELGIVAIPCEVFTEIGLEIKKKSPLKRTFTVSLANGYNGYLPTPAQHALGGYETWRARSSYLEVKASETITATAFDLLAVVARK
ncbi:MAG: Neutral/alkaline non-lysosomal ceramidase [Gemmataceae bacterium]|nr:Neutral/alkaline non-lysosomal ceramidase [Gemmataceae bacterium]